MISKLYVIERLWAKTKLVDGHFIWLGAVNKASKKKNGYPCIRVADKILKVTRLSVATYHKLDYNDKSWVACHICNERTCWNPLHLYAGTYLDNAMDTIKAGNHARWSGSREGYLRRSMDRMVDSDE